MARDWNKISAIWTIVFGVIGVPLAVAALLLTYWGLRLQMQQQGVPAVTGESGMSPWLPAIVLTSCLLLAGALYLTAALVIRAAKKREPVASVSGQSEIDKALIQSRARIGELEDELTKLQVRDDEYKSVIELAQQQRRTSLHGFIATQIR